MRGNRGCPVGWRLVHLDDVKASGFNGLVKQGVARFNKHANLADVTGNARRQFAGFLKAHGARAGWEEHETDVARPALDRSVKCFGGRDPAYFGLGGHVRYAFRSRLARLPQK